MRIVLFDAILERHVCESLLRALRARGHEVWWTGPVWRGHRFPQKREEIDRIDSALGDALRLRPDLLLNFRASSLLPDRLERLRDGGVRSFVWLPDDPVLYALCYRDAAPAYDVALHCGGEEVLRFYEQRHGRSGVNFPFWTDARAFPRSYDPAHAPFDLVFLGNCHGPVRSGRYALLASLPFRVRIFGRVPSDPGGLCGGYLERTTEISEALGQARCGISLPQNFRDYAGSDYDFPELASLGTFALPARITQYAACGLPVAAVGGIETAAALPEALVAPTLEQLIEPMRALLADSQRLQSVADATYERYRRSYSAASRAAMIEWLMAEPEAWTRLNARERARLYMQFEPLTPSRPPQAKPHVAGAQTELRTRRRVVLVGYYGARNLGDELILRSIVEGVRRRNPSIEFVIAARDAAATREIHGLPAFDRSDAAAAQEVLRGASAVVLGGGGLWNDYAFQESGGAAGLFRDGARSIAGYAKIPLLGALMDRPLHVFGMGVGPLTDREGAAVVRWVCDHAASVSVRDEASADVLRGIERWSAPVEVAPDAVFALDLPVGDPPADVRRLAEQRALLAINVRPWAGPDASALRTRLAQALASAARRHGLSLIGIPMQDGPRQDAAELRALFDEMEGAPPHVVMSASADPGAMLGALRSCCGGIAMRLHASLLLHRLGLPALGLAYDPKVHAHFAELGRADWSLPLHASVERIGEAIDRLVAQAGALDHDARRRVHAAERASRVALERLADRLTEAPPAADDELASLAPGGWSPPDAAHDVTPVAQRGLNGIRATVVGGSMLDGARDVPVSHRVRDGVHTFAMESSDPRKGDFAELRVSLEHAPGGCRTVLLRVRSPYCRARNRGRLVYQIRLDGRVLLEEDVAFWPNMNDVRIVWRAASERSELAIRVVALRNCESWSWGRAGRIAVHELTHEACDSQTPPGVLATSPYSRRVEASLEAPVHAPR